ncbi:hypothetical protein [Ilumatobacter nonamiensis]|uniref:hypothetical protein n=1 Tax=Ilumatobacter nonamiensis TaxID=467093 RepID=UPI00034A1653|nr:hypothetical protein [Ilumatobacter nonamiensis]
MNNEQNEDRRFSRRAAVQKAAVAGAVVWTTPMILSSTARAASGTEVEQECKSYWIFKLEAQGGQVCAVASGRSGGSTCADVAKANVPAGFRVGERVPGGGTVFSGFEVDGTDITNGSVSIDPAVGKILAVVGKKRRNDCTSFSGGSLANTEGQSHVMIVWCSPLDNPPAGGGCFATAVKTSDLVLDEDEEKKDEEKKDKEDEKTGASSRSSDQSTETTPATEPTEVTTTSSSVPEVVDTTTTTTAPTTTTTTTTTTAPTTTTSPPAD